MEKVIPDKQTTIRRNVIAIIAVIIWFYIDTGPDLFYGQYGALLLGALCAIVASFKNRNPIVWFAFGTWFVLASLIVLLCLSQLHDRLCPYCYKGISIKTIICPYCRSDIQKNNDEDSKSLKKYKIK